MPDTHDADMALVLDAARVSCAILDAGDCDPDSGDLPAVCRHSSTEWCSRQLARQAALDRILARLTATEAKCEAMRGILEGFRANHAADVNDLLDAIDKALS